MTESPTLVSACLLGLACRWDGRSKPAALDLLGPVLPVCPEGAAGFLGEGSDTPQTGS